MSEGMMDAPYIVEKGCWGHQSVKIIRGYVECVDDIPCLAKELGSYVAAVFSDESSVQRIEQEARTACDRLGAEVVEIVSASSEPKHTLGRRIRQAVRRIF
jgi:hypothetical protein